MRKISSDQPHVVGLLNENEKLHKQNECLMKELSLIKIDFQRMSSNGTKTVKNGRRKSCEIPNEIIQKQQLNQLQEELDNCQIKYNILVKELSKYNNLIQNQNSQIEKLNKENQQLKRQQIKEYQTEPLVEKSEIKISNENQKIKQLSEGNMRLTKLLEERLIQLEQMTKVLNQKNDEHNKEIEKYEKLLSLKSNNQIDILLKKIEQLEKDKNKLGEQLSKGKDLNLKEKEILQKEKQNINLEKEKLSTDLQIIQEQLKDYYERLQYCDKQLKLKDESIKKFQQNDNYNGFQSIQFELEQSKSIIYSLQTQISHLQQANKALNEELQYLKTSLPLTNRTNLKTFFGLDSPYKQLADEQNKYSTNKKTKTSGSIENRKRSKDKFRINE